MICGRLCRSVPGEVMHDPAPESAAPLEPCPENEPTLVTRESGPPTIPEEELDPLIQAQMTASLEQAGRSSPPSAPRLALWATLGSGISPTSRAVVDDLRNVLRANSGAPGKIPPPRTAPHHDLVDDPTTSRWERTS